MKGANNDNEELTFIQIGAATANVLAYLLRKRVVINGDEKTEQRESTAGKTDSCEDQRKLERVTARF